MNYLVTERDERFFVVDLDGVAKAGPYGKRSWASTNAARINDKVPADKRADPNLRVEQRGDMFVIIAGKGIVAGGPYQSEMSARTQIKNLLAKAARRTPKKMRPCMSCRNDFASEGIHNRLCHNCKSNSGMFVEGGSTGSRTMPRRSS